MIAALGLAACALAALGIYWFQTRWVARPSNLVACLPAANASVVYFDVDALRRSGILGMLSASKSAEDPDYRQFVEETQFDYERDLNAVAAAVKDGRIYFALRGRFRWSNLAAYAARQGGSCHKDYCVVPGSQPNRRISFYMLQRDVLALAVAPDDFAAYQVTSASGKDSSVPPKDPVWALIPAPALATMDALPAAAKAYVPALQGAQQIIFSIAGDSTQHLQLGIHVTCKDPTAATALVAQLEVITKTLRELIAKQREKPGPADLSQVLVAGSFRRDERQVYGEWPIPRAFLDAIAGTVY